VNKHDSLGAEALDDGPVVDDLVINVEGSAEQLDGLFQALDRHVDAGTKTAGVGKDNPHDVILINRLQRHQPTKKRHPRAAAGVSCSIAVTMAYLNSKLLTVTTILSPSFFTVPTTVPGFTSWQTAAWCFLLAVGSSQ